VRQKPLGYAIRDCCDLVMQLWSRQSC